MIDSRETMPSILGSHQGQSFTLRERERKKDLRLGGWSMHALYAFVGCTRIACLTKLGRLDIDHASPVDGDRWGIVCPRATMVALRALTTTRADIVITFRKH